jgi:trk system potassium uptake protein TrkA
MEAVVHGNDRSSKVVGRRLIDLGLPEGTTIGALVRNNKVLIAHDELQIESEDHVILFLTDKTRIGAVERLFQVNFNFF